MRPGLRWALGLSTLLSLVSLLWEPGGERISQTVQAVRRDGAEIPRTATGEGISTRAAPAESGVFATAALPAVLNRQPLTSARRDFFFAPPARPVPATAPAPVADVAPAPQAPPADYRFLGRLTAPDGRRLVYLQKGETAVAVGVGATLDDGYVVETLTEREVGLLYPPAQQRVLIPVPPVRVE